MENLIPPLGYRSRYPDRRNGMVTASQILAERALQLLCDEQCFDWAICLLESGHETTSACRLASKLRHHNHFELADLQDRILVEIGIDDIPHSQNKEKLY